MHQIETATGNLSPIANAIRDTAGIEPTEACALCAARHEGPVGALCRACFSQHVGSRPPQLNLTKVRVRREPIFLKDTDGADIALLKTNKSGLTVKLLASDLHELVARGFTDQVTLMRDRRSGFHYATVNVTGMPGGAIQLSRLIVGAKRKTNVTYADSDRQNLRRDNLVIVKGCGRQAVQVANRIKLADARTVNAERA